MSNEIPKLQVQRMGKKWRIVYADTRGLARFNSGQPLDLCEGSEAAGGFLDVRDGATLTVDGRVEASKRMSSVLENLPPPETGRDWMDTDPEAEGIGN
jgi:hypothetical protein